MAQFEIWLASDLNSLPDIKFLHGTVFTQDAAGHTVGVAVTQDHRAVELRGTVTGYVTRADGATVIVPGQLLGNRAWLELPESAYAVPGYITIVIRNVDGESRTVLAACRVSVLRASSDAIVDPGHVIPSLEELLAQIDTMERATEAGNQAAAQANAAAEGAQAAAKKLEGMTVTASKLATGKTPTAKVSETGGHYNIAFGIPQGAKGDNAEIISTDISYQSSTSGTAYPTGTWQSTVPTVPQGDFLWGKMVLTWNNGQTTTLYSVSRMGIDGMGSVVSVNGVSPDASGDVALDMPAAIPQQELQDLVEGGETA